MYINDRGYVEKQCPGSYERAIERAESKGRPTPPPDFPPRRHPSRQPQKQHRGLVGTACFHSPLERGGGNIPTVILAVSRESLLRARRPSCPPMEDSPTGFVRFSCALSPRRKRRFGVLLSSTTAAAPLSRPAGQPAATLSAIPSPSPRTSSCPERVAKGASRPPPVSFAKW